jgi:hypothetical protein
MRLHRTAARRIYRGRSLIVHRLKGGIVTMDETRAPSSDAPIAEAAAPAKILPPAACRALAEAEERRRLVDAAAVSRPREINGRDGPEPARYGDWEIRGIACDF